MFVVDTNVLIYAADLNSVFHRRCFDLLQEWREQASAWYVTWGILYEFMRVSTHPRVFRNPWSIDHAWSFIEAILASPFLGLLVPSDRHAEIASAVFDEAPHISGNLVHDATTAILMREHGIRRIYTRDTDFHRFSFLEPIDPIVN